MKSVNQGDVLVFLGDNGHCTGIVIAVSGIDGSARVVNGDNRVTVAPHNFFEVFPATENTVLLANFLSR